jgi:hypothetical protein
LSLTRYVLRPKTQIDAELLYSTEGIRAVVPLAHYLRSTGLPFKMTPAVMLNAAIWATTQGSYQEAEDAILLASKLKINDDTIRQIANYIGDIVFQEDCRLAEDAWRKLNGGELRFPYQKKGILYIEPDGAALNTRSKDENGSSWRENKLGIVFSSDNIHTWTNCKGEKQHQISKREYVAYMGGVSEFKKHLLSCALKNGYGDYKETVLISDGATWIRNMRDELFPDAQQILDYYHLCENVNTYAKQLFGMEPSQYSEWANEICNLLKASRWAEVLVKLESIKKPSYCPIDLHGYISHNIANIDYVQYLDKGYFIGSGAIESGNKSVLQQRLKQAGMRWNTHTAQCLLTLRAKYKSGLWKQEVQRPILHLLQEN